jgi:hypothetical protein
VRAKARHEPAVQGTVPTTQPFDGDTKVTACGAKWAGTGTGGKVVGTGTVVAGGTVFAVTTVGTTAGTVVGPVAIVEGVDGWVAGTSVRTRDVPPPDHSTTASAAAAATAVASTAKGQRWRALRHEMGDE